MSDITESALNGEADYAYNISEYICNGIKQYFVAIC